MIISEHYVEVAPSAQDGVMRRVEYTARAIPTSETLSRILLSRNQLFNITTPLGDTFSFCRKESIQLTGAPGIQAQIDVKISYVQRVEDQDASEAVSIIPSDPSADRPEILPAEIDLPVKSHHWVLEVSDAYVSPKQQLTATGTCINNPEIKASLLAGINGTAGTVKTPQFGLVAGMIKNDVRFDPWMGLRGDLQYSITWASLTAPDPEEDEYPVVTINHTTGITPGSATITKPGRATPVPTTSYDVGDTMNLSNFHGTVVEISKSAASNSASTTSVTAYDNRWAMMGIIIGSSMIQGPGAALYARRGFEFVFNRYGFPDKGETQVWDETPGAVFWTFADILQALCDSWLPSSMFSGIPNWSLLEGSNRTPGEFDARGIDMATAIDTLLAQLGYTWTIRYSSGGQQLFAFRTSVGNVSIPIASLASDPTAATASQNSTIRDSYGKTEILSGPILLQCGWTDDPEMSGYANLIKQEVSDGETWAIFKPDSTNLESLFPGLIKNKEEHARGYRFHHELVDRTNNDGSDYLPERLSTDEITGKTIPAGVFAWCRIGEGEIRRIAGGIEIQQNPPFIRVNRSISVYVVGATPVNPETETIRPAELTTFYLLMTLAIVSDFRLLGEAGDLGDLPIDRIRIANRDDIIPAYAEKSFLEAIPVGISDSLNDLIESESGLTALVNAQGQLDDLADAAHASQSTAAISTDVSVKYWPSVKVGNALSLSGGGFESSAGMVTDIRFSRGKERTCQIRATNQPISRGQGQLMTVEAARQHFLREVGYV
jgi:hypothetical protein